MINRAYPMSAITITATLTHVVNAFDVGREIYQTVVNAMDAAEKEKNSGADKKAWVLAFMESFVYEAGEKWEHWAKVIIAFIDFAKSLFNKNK